MRRAAKWLWELYLDMDRARTFGLAAQIAFWLFLSLIPLLAAAGLVAARVSLGNWQHFAPVLGALPDPMRAVIQDQLGRVARWNGGTVGITGAAVFVWLASTGVHAIFDAFEIQSRAQRSWAKRRLLAIATCLGLALVVPMLTFLGPGMGRVVERVLPVLIDSASWSAASSLVHIARLGLSFAIAMAYVYALYFIGMPRAGRRNATLVSGALVAVLLEAAMSFGYGFYLSHFTEQAFYAAGLGLVAATLMALYVFALSLLCGAAVIRKLDAAAGPNKRPAVRV